VFGDAQRLTQLVLVLLDNAIRYSHPHGCVQWQLTTQQGQALLQVSDQGIGIPQQEQSQVFERHFRGTAARQHRASGSGLGLPIARALAQAHGGSLTLHSPWPDHGLSGTCMELRLPLWHGPEGPPLMPATPPAPRASGTSGAPDAPGEPKAPIPKHHAPAPSKLELP
jgi:signal transduction histidine kinase